MKDKIRNQWLREIITLFVFSMCMAAHAREFFEPRTSEIIPFEYDFEKDGIYYKFAPAPDCSYYDVSYYNDNGELVKDGFYTGLEKDEGDILWITGKEYTYETGDWYLQMGGVMGYVYYSNETYTGDVFFPDSVEYNGRMYPVKGLCKDAFQYTPQGEYGHEPHKITSIRLPNTLEYIDDEALRVGSMFNNSQLFITELPPSVKYIGRKALGYNTTWKIGDNVLMLKEQLIQTDDHDIFYYPQNAVYAGQVGGYKKRKEVFPKKMRHLVAGSYPSEMTTAMVIPNNGEFFVHQYGLPLYVSTIFSYAPIMRNTRPGYGFRTLTNVYAKTSCQYEKTLYVLSGLKDAYAEEWPELLAGAPYTKDDETLYFTEDHIIEVSREEMDAMVEAAGLTVPTAVSEVEVNPSKKLKEAVFTLDGRHWSTLQKGVNIVRQSDGTTKKVYVK